MQQRDVDVTAIKTRKQKSDNQHNEENRSRISTCWDGIKTDSLVRPASHGVIMPQLRLRSPTSQLQDLVYPPGFGTSTDDLVLQLSDDENPRPDCEAHVGQDEHNTDKPGTSQGHDLVTM